MGRRSRISRNFVPLLRDMTDAGLSQTEVARRLGAPQSTIQGAFTADHWEPGWAFGQLVIALHKRVMRQAKRRGGVAA